MKVDIKRLDSVTHNDTTATKLINDNFNALQQGVEDSLSRTGKTPNFMDSDLDMNTYRIINVSDPISDHDVANKKYVDEKAISGIGIVAGNGIYLYNKSVTFSSSATSANFDLAGLIDSNVMYYPIIRLHDSEDVVKDYAYYDNLLKSLTLYRTSTGSSQTVVFDVCLLPILGTSTESYGIANGHGEVVSKSDIASAVSGSSTNSQVVGAKLFYDTCGDIETLIDNL